MIEKKLNQKRVQILKSVRLALLDIPGVLSYIMIFIISIFIQVANDKV